MFDRNNKQNKTTVLVLFKAIQATLTKSIGSKNLKAFSPAPQEAREFDEATTSIIFDKLATKLNQKGK